MLLPLLTSLAFATPEDHVMTNNHGSLLHWETMPINYVADPTNPGGIDENGALAAIVAAGGAWTEVSGVAVEYRFRGVETGLTGGFDEKNVVFFAPDWDASPDLLAVTSSWSNEEGSILDFDMVVNASDHAWSLDGTDGTADLQNALAHEFGHALGIGHTPDDELATMYPSASLGETDKRDLGSTDIEVAAWLYPSLPEEEEEPHAMGPFGCNTSPSFAFSALLPAALFLSRRRKECV